MKWISASVSALLLTQSLLIHGSTGPVPVKSESARQFVQAFYDWYTPKALNGSAGDGWDLVLKSKRFVFSQRLVQALREDSAAAAKVKGEIVGLDFDPFLNSQDPDTRYLVRKVEQKGRSTLVSVHGVSDGKPSAKADVIVKLDKQNGHWRVTNFLYPIGDDLLGVLKKLKQERIHHR